MKQPRFKVGDQVRVIGIPTDSDEYDIGTVVRFTFAGVKVHWQKADEIYSEDPAKLEVLP